MVLTLSREARRVDIGREPGGGAAGRHTRLRENGGSGGAGAAETREGGVC